MSLIWLIALILLVVVYDDMLEIAGLFFRKIGRTSSAWRRMPFGINSLALFTGVRIGRFLDAGLSNDASRTDCDLGESNKYFNLRSEFPRDIVDEARDIHDIAVWTNRNVIFQTPFLPVWGAKKIDEVNKIRNSGVFVVRKTTAADLPSVGHEIQFDWILLNPAVTRNAIDLHRDWKKGPLQVSGSDRESRNVTFYLIHLGKCDVRLREVTPEQTVQLSVDFVQCHKLSPTFWFGRITNSDS